MFDLKHVYTSSLSFHLGYWSSTVEQSMFFILLFFLQHCFTLGHRFYHKAQLHSLPPSLPLSRCATHMHAHTHTCTQSCYVLHWRPTLLLDAKNQVARTYTWLYRTLSFAVSLTCSHTHSLIHPPNRMRVGFGGGVYDKTVQCKCWLVVLSPLLSWLSLPPFHPGIWLSRSLSPSVSSSLLSTKLFVFLTQPPPVFLISRIWLLYKEKKTMNDFNWSHYSAIYCCHFKEKKKIHTNALLQTRECLFASVSSSACALSESQ